MIEFNNFNMKKGDPKKETKENSELNKEGETALQNKEYQEYLEKQKAEEKQIDENSDYINKLKAFKEQMQNAIEEEDSEKEENEEIPENDNEEEEIHFIEEAEDEFDETFANTLDNIENIQSGINENFLQFADDDKFSILNLLEDYDEDENNYSLDEEVEEEKPTKRIIYIDKSKKDLDSFERLMIKTRPDEYRLGKDPNQVSIKKKKHNEKIRNMSEDELTDYYSEKNKKAEEKAALKFMKDVDKLKKKKKSKKYQKLQEKINKAYLAEKKLENEKIKSYEDLIIKKEVKNWENSVYYNYFFGKNKKKFDPYARYRQSGNIITVSELEDYKNDFNGTYLKNLENAIMNKLNEPLELKSKTTVEYYDKKGRLTTREILPEDKKNKKKKKKKRNKQKKHEMSPDFDDLY